MDFFQHLFLFLFLLPGINAKLLTVPALAEQASPDQASANNRVREHGPLAPDCKT
jgi:hypothetical protein